MLEYVGKERDVGEWYEAYQKYVGLIKQVDGIFNKIRENHYIVADSMKPVVDTVYWEHRKLLEFVIDAHTVQQEQAKQAVDAAILGAALSSRLNLSILQSITITEAALLHDVGMLIIPKEILTKAESLSPTEQRYILTHPIQSYKLIEREFHVFEKVSQIAMQRHEHWNGEGYPKRLARTNIALEARILGVVDTFAALVEKRPYREALSGHQAVKQLAATGANQFFDPAVLQHFIRMMGIYPIGSLVGLTNGASARIIGYAEDASLRKPIVRIVKTAPKDPLPQGAVLNLADEKARLDIERPLKRQDILMDFPTSLIIQTAP